MQRLADDAATSLRNEYTIQLMKLPKKVRPREENVSTTSDPRARALSSLSCPLCSEYCQFMRELMYCGDTVLMLMWDCKES